MPQKLVTLTNSNKKIADVTVPESTARVLKKQKDAGWRDAPKSDQPAQPTETR